MGRLMDAVVNEEQLLHMSLFVAKTVADPSDEMRTIADSLIVAYIVEQRAKNEALPKYTIEEVQEEYSRILSSFILKDMIKEGKIEVMIDELGEMLLVIDKKKKESDDA